MDGAALAVSIIALALTGLGWFVNSWLNVRAQRQALVNSLTNDARITLIDAITEFHKWCMEIKSIARGMPIDDITSGGQTTEHHERRKREIFELSIESRHSIWLRRLEEYEPLFPGTTPVRAHLLNRLMAVCKSARTLDKHAPGSPPPEEELDRFDEEVTDILALTWDLRIYVQNVSIGKITGNAIPERQPLDTHSIRLISDQRGYLSVNQPRQEGELKVSGTFFEIKVPDTFNSGHL